MSASAAARRAKVAADAAAIIERDDLPIGPRMIPCACGAERHLHGGATFTGKHEPTGCRRYREDTAWALAWAAMDASGESLGDALRRSDAEQREKHYRINPRKPGEWSIGASDAATCPRKIQYRNTPPEDFEPAPDDSPEARMGTIIHREVTRQMKALYPWRLFDLKVRIPGLDRDSEVDCYDPVTGIVEDYKTAGDWKWDMLGIDGPDEETWEQVLLYGLALVALGYRVTAVRLSYIKRCNGHDEIFTRDFDLVRAEAARDRLLGYAEALDHGIDLPKTGTGPTTDGLCRRCFARWHCWNMPAAERLGRSPENLTILGETPEEEAIIWAAKERLAAGEARLAAEKSEDQTKALVDGLEPGRYGPLGEVTVERTFRKGNPNHKAHAETLKTYLDLPDGLRPTSETVGDAPRYPTSSYTTVKRTRKATLEKEARERAKSTSAEEATA